MVRPDPLLKYGEIWHSCFMTFISYMWFIHHIHIKWGGSVANVCVLDPSKHRKLYQNDLSFSLEDTCTHHFYSGISKRSVHQLGFLTRFWPHHFFINGVKATGNIRIAHNFPCLMANANRYRESTLGRLTILKSFLDKLHRKLVAYVRIKWHFSFV